ncbi:centrosomal protein of 192 kDa isoform X4 [Heterocephalus glaber]|uniref:Centrosomal protein of 192 kDa isoform X4 n=1 Tax=Heterocephalus glaber TaxID=10181 RepID=A0AAX6TL59_HETGA|nr:centrosomal protein of 192 kDa isoform X4 [Heterocephalus glaber]
MEDFRGIAEESFPSFLTNSFLGNSGILEEVTLSSKLGLPVAVSTLARNRASTGNSLQLMGTWAASKEADGFEHWGSRLSFFPWRSSDTCEGEIMENKEKQKPYSRKKNNTESPHLSHAVLKLSSLQSAGPGMGEQPADTAATCQASAAAGRASPPKQAPDSSADFHVRSRMNNQEYKVVVPDAQKHSEDKTPNSDFSHLSLLENEKLVSLTSVEDSSDDDINDEEFYDDHLESYFEQLAIPGMIYEDLEGQESLERDFRLSTRSPSQANENSSLRCKIQSEDNSTLISHGSELSRATHRETEESRVCLSGTTHYVGPGDGRMLVDGVFLFSPNTCRVEKGRADHTKECTREDVLVQSPRVITAKLHPICFHDMDAGRGGSDPADSVGQGAEPAQWASDSGMILPKDGCLDAESSAVPGQKSVGTTSLKHAGDNGTNSTDTLWSPTCERRTCQCSESMDKSKDQTNLPQNVVYQNEDGRWVTDLAYYTSFNNEQDLKVPPNDMNEVFRSGSEVLDLIAKDEEEFNKEHQFIQEENIDAQNISAALGDTSWAATINYNLLRKSVSTSDLDKDDASYLRLSLGEFFAQRSEALGCLGGGNNVKRPSFGYFISSPEKSEPIALIRKSEVSRSNLEKEMAHLNSNLSSGDLNEQSQAQLSKGPVTLQVDALESPSEVDENDETLTADQGQTEDTFFRNNKLQERKEEPADHGDSVLRISTIASAIADASVSTDPSQFAAMMKALRNRARGGAAWELGERVYCAELSRRSPGDLERSDGFGAFDMEKYLTKTEVSRCEAGLESMSGASPLDVWNLSLPEEQTIPGTHTVSSCATSVSVQEPGEKAAAAFYGGNGESENQDSFRTTDSSNSALTDRRENERAAVDRQTPAFDSASPDTGYGAKAASVSTLAPSIYASVTSPTGTPLCLVEACEETQNRRQKEGDSKTSSGDTHVTFEKHCVSPRSVGLRNTSPERGRAGLEEQEQEQEQESFRPSTPPLSHSSPSEGCRASLSGGASESLNSAACPQKSPAESELSRLACSHADTSRLTYVSEPESICPASATDSPRQSELASELSTTIIRSSPVPPEEDAALSLGQRGVRSEAAAASLAGGPRDTEPHSNTSQDPSSVSGEQWEAREAVRTSRCGRCQVLGQPGLGHWAGPAAPQPADGGQRPASGEARSASRAQAPHRSVPTCQPAPATALQSASSVCPALWAGAPLATAALAQQCMGTSVALPPPGHAGSALVCRLPGCPPYPATAGEHVQNPVAVGLCLGPSPTSGLLGPSALGSPCSDAFCQHLLGTVQPLPAHPARAACGTEHWNSGMAAGFASVRVPEELKFPSTCCVGIASQTRLSVLNPSDRWLQVSVVALSVSVNGEKVDLSTYPCLVFKNKVIVRPHATEEIAVLLLPLDPGLFRCVFRVASWPFSADPETIMQAEALASRVVLTAIAESPAIEVETERKGVLDFGDLTYGGWKALPLKLINRSHASVPLRLSISANAVAWCCFTLSKEPVPTSLKAAPYADVVAQLAAPSVVSHVMPASYEGQDPKFLIIWVLFHTPKKLIASSEILDPAEEFVARVDIEVDSPNPSPALSSVGLRARAGTARIHAPRDLQTVHLLASVNSAAKQPLPLKNAGNIEVYLDIKVPEQGSHFSVYPENLFLKPGEEHEVMVSFTPRDPKACEERILKIFVHPCGPQYEVVLKGEAVSSGSQTVPPGPCCPDLPSLLSNKQFLAWGGVPLGRTQLQKLVLRSSCASTAQHLRLLIRGQDQDCFQLQNTFGSEERLTSNCEVRIGPKEDIVISVLFAPTRLSCMLAKLEIKQLRNRLQPGVKFMIPLSGYGGTSNLILEGVKKLSDSYMVTVNSLVPGKESRAVLSVRNTGSRAAFIKAVGFRDYQKKVLLDPKVLRILPDKFVLKERTQEDITIIYRPPDRGRDHRASVELSTVYFFGGDEICRQQYRRAVSQNPGVVRRILPAHSVLHSVDFAEVFQDELLVDEVYDLPQRPNDVQLFYGNMRKIILSVLGEFRDSISSREFLPPSSQASLESRRDEGLFGRHSGNVSLDVLPVRGPQGSPFPPRAARLHQAALALGEAWAVQPEHVILLVPSALGDKAKTGHFQIVNDSARTLKFELYWPAHCLTVTPEHGVVPPESKQQILVSPNLSLSAKQSMFPWSGLVYVHCDDGEKKIVKVQIREDLTQEDLLSHLASGMFGILAPASEPPVSHWTKPATKPPSTRVQIRSKTITFPATAPGETSESCLELENHGPTDVRWHVSSFAPPYVKGVDESGDVFRATYAAFRCAPLSGTLGSHGTQKVSVTFLPRDRGNYAQFWDVECHPVKEPHLRHTLRFQLSGQSVRAGEEPPAHAATATGSLARLEGRPRRRAASEPALPPGPPEPPASASPRGVYTPQDAYTFPPTRVGEARALKVSVRNSSFVTRALKFVPPREPFHVRHSRYSLRARHYIHIPVHFRPTAAGSFQALLLIQTDGGRSTAVRLSGEALEDD